MFFITNSNITESKKQFLTFIKKVKKDKTWVLSNKVIYDLCKNNPGHKRIDEVLAKTIIIGRVYSASLERGVSANKEKGDTFYTCSVYNAFKKFYKRKDIRELLTKVKQDKNIEAGISIHTELVENLKELRDLKKTSFVSKYLHFHFPDVFYIIDSRAKKALPIVEKYLNIPKQKFKSSAGKNKISEYSKFVYRSVYLKTEIKRQLGVVLTVRQFDALLINVANSLNIEV